MRVGSQPCWPPAAGGDRPKKAAPSRLDLPSSTAIHPTTISAPKQHTRHNTEDTPSRLPLPQISDQLAQICVSLLHRVWERPTLPTAFKQSLRAPQGDPRSRPNLSRRSVPRQIDSRDRILASSEGKWLRILVSHRTVAVVPRSAAGWRWALHVLNLVVALSLALSLGGSHLHLLPLTGRRPTRQRNRQHRPGLRHQLPQKSRSPFPRPLTPRRQPGLKLPRRQSNPPRRSRTRQPTRRLRRRQQRRLQPRPKLRPRHPLPPISCSWRRFLLRRCHPRRLLFAGR